MSSRQAASAVDAAKARKVARKAPSVRETRVMPDRFRLKERCPPSCPKRAAAERSAARKGEPCRLAVGLPRAEDCARELRAVGCVGEELRLEAAAGIRSVAPPAEA